MICSRLASQPSSTSNGGFHDVKLFLLVRTGSSMHTNLRTCFATELCARLLTELVEAAAGVGVFDAGAGASGPGSIDRSFAPPAATGPAPVSVVGSDAASLVFPSGSAPARGNSASLAFVVVL